jgi:hypothetical protein
MSRKRDGLYRRGNIFAFRYKDADGIWREKQTGKRDRQEAKDVRKEFLGQVESGTLPTHMADWTLEQARTWWIDFRKPRIGAATLSAEGYRTKPLIRLLGNIRLRQITNVELDNYVTKRLAEEIAPWSINKEILTWSMILRKAKLWRRLADDYRPFRPRHQTSGEHSRVNNFAIWRRQRRPIRIGKPHSMGQYSPQTRACVVVRSKNFALVRWTSKNGSFGFAAPIQNLMQAAALLN